MTLVSIAGRLAGDVQRALQQLALPMPTAIERQSLGLSNQSFRLDFHQTSLLLRLNSPVTDRICNRDNEVACWRAAQTAGLAPQLRWVDSDKRFYLSEWLTESANGVAATYVPWRQLAVTLPHKLSSASLASQSPVTEASATEWYPAQQLLQLLLGLRELPPPALDISLQLQWQIYLVRLQQMAANGDYAGANTHHAAQWLQRLQWLQQLSLSARFATLDACLLSHQYCHRDLSAHNLLLHNDRLYCIDFEYCCSSHPLFELAGVIACHQLSAAARQWLIREYLDGHPYLTSSSEQALAAALDIFWLYSCAWALQMADGRCRDGREFFSWFDNYRQLIRE
ncbi:phosphotransferase [Shewanella dokdonensis]|uniref:Phosphotransferase n=1 Tax=Shewanella dokdonensis TaxID=712036 RepID=A0ABX8DFG4_9GAMM|nr:phosphotransferase [Shewanella dokdonensis]MCL1075064.1 phosphotransferase [Shewanella dokdonensis]QVK23479.1 phosphotransferase [Shewanella dokdonensis]